MIRIKKQETDSGTSHWRFMGTKVFSSSGEYCGRVTGLNIAGGRLAGFQLWYRFNSIFIESSYVSNLEALARETSVLLGETPYYTMLGKTVYDKKGKKRGVVKTVEQQGSSNDFDAIVVKSSIFRRSIRIEKARVEVAKKSVIVKLV